MLSNIETGSTLPFSQEVRGIQGKCILIAGDCEVSKATGALLAGQGARVFFAAANAEALGELLSAVAHARGEGEGMIANLENAEEMRRFFAHAKRQLGQVDVLIHQHSLGNLDSDGVNELVEATIQHMRQMGSGHIIAINPAGGGGTANLRRKATNFGIRVTRIEPSAENYRWAREVMDGSPAADIAHCVYESIAQPFAADVIFINDPFQEPFGGQLQ